MKMITNEQYS